MQFSAYLKRWVLLAALPISLGLLLFTHALPTAHGQLALNGTIELLTDANSNNIVNIGDTVRIQLERGDGGGCSFTAAVNLLQYGGGTSVSMGPCDGSSESFSRFTLDWLVTDPGVNGIEVGTNNAASRVTITLSDESTVTTNAIGDGLIDSANGVDTIVPAVNILLPVDGGTSQHASPLEVFTSESSDCTYALDEDAPGPIAQSFNDDTLHTDRFLDLSAGEHAVTVICIDEAGNSGEASSTWTKIDPDQVLYGADGEGGNPNTLLYLLDPETGNILTAIGPIQDGTDSEINYPVTGLAFDPTTGLLYATTGDDIDSDRSEKLIRIDPMTGLATLIGPVVSIVDEGEGESTVSHTMGDIAFAPDGTLYGWSECGCEDDLYTIDLTTGVATLTSDSGLDESVGSALEFAPRPAENSNYNGIENINTNSTLYSANEGDDGNLYVLNATSGEVDALIPFANPLEPWESYPLGAFTADQNGVLFASRLSTGLEPEDDADLVVVDPNTGVLISMGENADMNGMEALAFGPTLTLTIDNPLEDSTVSSNFNLQLSTNRGAMCEYELDGGGLAFLSSTGELLHSQDFSGVTSGNHSLFVQCTDGLFTVSDSVSFRIGSGGGGGGGGGVTISAPLVSRLLPEPATGPKATNEKIVCHAVDTNLLNPGLNLNTAVMRINNSNVNASVQATNSNNNAVIGADMTYVPGPGAFYPANSTVTVSCEIQNNQSRTGSTSFQFGTGSTGTTPPVTGNGNTNSPFTDSQGNPFINTLAKECGAEGYLDVVTDLRSFLPDRDISRGELIKLLIGCQFGLLPPVTTKPFPDVEVNSPFAPYIAKAKELRAIIGYPDGQFRPDNPITRPEGLKVILLLKFPMADILAVLGSNPENLYTDTLVGQWYYRFVYFAAQKRYELGYVDSDGNPFHIFGVADHLRRGDAARWIVLILLGG